MPKIKVDKGLLLKVASNARLNLSDKEIEKFLPQLADVLDYFSMLDELDVSAQKPSFQAIESKNALREDCTKESITQEKALSNTENKKDGYFKGPAIL